MKSKSSTLKLYDIGQVTQVLQALPSSSVKWDYHHHTDTIIQITILSSYWKLKGLKTEKRSACKTGEISEYGI